MGKDKPGLVDSLAKCVYKHQGNWQGSSFAHMAGMFTGFVEVHVSEDEKQNLIDALDSIKDLSVQSVAVATSGEINSTKLTVDVMGNDKTGIVQELTSVLNQFNLNIVTFSSHCESAPNWGSLIFKAKAEIAVPADFDDDALQDALEALANDLVVDITAKR
jgi:glycine cleavage system regulatory protein